MEIRRFLETRMRAEMERRFAMGFVMAKAFNDPKLLSQDLESWQRRIRPRRDDDYESDGSDILSLFRRSGLRVEDSVH